jgi:hypothetical protein
MIQNHWITCLWIVRQRSICAIVENTWHKYIEWFYKRREILAVWEAQGLMFSQNIIKLIKYHGNKRITYDIMPLDWGYKLLVCNNLELNNMINLLYNFFSWIGYLNYILFIWVLLNLWIILSSWLKLWNLII